jgi:hypothetical protein
VTVVVTRTLSPDEATTPERPFEALRQDPGPAAILALQRSAGNQSVSSRLARCADSQDGEPRGCKTDKPAGDERIEAALRRTVIARAEGSDKRVGARCACGGTILPGGECTRCLTRRLTAEGMSPTAARSVVAARESALARMLSRQEDDAPRRVPSLHPAGPAVSGPLADVAEGGTESAPKTGSAAPPPWMPHYKQNLPIKLGQGTKRSPKLKDEDAPGGAKCRGACGVDCPKTCKVHETYEETYEVGDTTYVIEFPDPLECGTHEGCRMHDGCFDAAEAAGEHEMGGPKHYACNQEALFRYGPKTKDWALGNGPYDGWWWFVENPRVKSKTPKAKPAGQAPPQ